MKNKFIWLSDVHLDMLSNRAAKRFTMKLCDAVNVEERAGVLVTGDVATSEKCHHLLKQVYRYLNVPVYYVHGNHDYWYSSFAQVEASAIEFSSACHGVIWLSNVDNVRLSDNVALVGVDSWYDVQNGDAHNSSIFMNDWTKIRDFIDRGNVCASHALCAKRGHDAAQAAQVKVNVAVASGAKSVIFLTHVPPFQECLSDCDSQHSFPFYSSKFLGDVLRHSAETHPNVWFTVLCGHTHSWNVYSPLSNLVCYTASAEYGDPAARMFEVIL